MATPLSRDDRRPVFQQRIGEATSKPAPYDTVIVQLKAQRESVLGEMARSKQAEASPLSALSNAQLAAFATSMRSRLLDRSNGFPKAYLQALVSEIVYDGEKVLMQGRKAAALAAAAGKKMGTFGKVPTFRLGWLPEQGSNRT